MNKNMNTWKNKFNSWKNTISDVEFEALGYKKEHYRVGYIKENGYPMYFSRAPLYFRDCQNLSKGIYFSNFFAWMGKIRESAMSPILPQLTEDFADGTKGMITNHCNVKILGDALSGDTIETRFSLLNIPDDSTLELLFVWKRLLADGSYEDIAYGEMSVSWVEILSHGIIKLVPFPAYYMDFITKMKSTSKEGFYDYEIKEHAYESFEKGAEHYIAPIVPRRGKLLHEEIIRTTLEDGNSVGNIYFSNYSRWQGLVRDAFFHNIESKYFEGTGTEGELIVTENSVQHLQEIMPFSTVQIIMNVVEVWENSISLEFAYYQVDNDKKIKLAIGSQTLYWARRDTENNFSTLSFPKEYKEKLLEIVS